MKGISDRRSAKFLMLGICLFGLSIPISKSASNILIGCIYLGTACLALANRSFNASIKRWLVQPLLLPLGAYLGVAILGLAFTSNLHDGIGIINKMIGMLLVYLMTSALLDHIDQAGESGSVQRNTQLLLILFMTGIFILDIIGVLTYLGFIGHQKHVLPIFAPFHIWYANLNAIGVYAATAIILYDPERLSAGKKVFFVLFLFLAALFILLSLSRTAWLGMLITVIVLAFLLVRNRKALYGMMAVILIAGILLYFFNGIVQSRVNLIVSDIASYARGHTETNIGERFLMWKAAFRMFLSNPVFGVGTGDYVFTMRSYIAGGDMPAFLLMFNQPHNMYLFALATNGLLGLAALLFIFYSVMKASLPLLKTRGITQMLAFWALATTVHYMVAGLTDSLFNIQILRYTFGFVIGVCVRQSLRKGGELKSKA
jgi:O-antigen ligase